ncbi:SseB family protein [Tranquillimonas alkanivorans]|uniref:SseB protein N-terminal domain-containing protein n=1 Tax=Tranquillimonas alkanivorans TaxID=441119 RepID=A0A1I5MGV2_9RHOB|nr:SseB family protein [Tranquillimonas alkanivorans]SFP08166.1 SseB protein N-terminal domain-containing protein [Tranquillimonas alkanivorans]
MTETPLDRAHATMEAAPDDDAARLAFYDRLAEAELFLLLDEEPEGETLNPAVWPLESGPTVLAFDTEERLAEFTGQISPYAALSGRAVAGMLAGQGAALGLNLGVAPSAILLPSDALAWLAETLSHRPETVEARPQDLSRPDGLPDRLLNALDAKLATASGLARLAYLAAVTYDTGAKGHLLAFIDAAPGAEAALAQATGEALTFSGLEAGVLDVAFFASTDPVAARLARAGLRIDLPEPERPQVPGGAPGMDPDRPPKLK